MKEMMVRKRNCISWAIHLKGKKVKEGLKF